MTIANAKLFLMRHHGGAILLLAALAMLTAACSPEAPVPQKRDELYPKIVLQTLPTNGVEIAAWTPDDKYIVTAVGQTRSVAIWEVATGNIIDRLILPADENETGVVRRLRSMEVSPDGRTVTIDAETSYFADNQFSAPIAHRYRLDLASKKIISVPVPEGTENIWTGSQIEDAVMALGAIYEDDEEFGLERAEQMLLPLPKSHDGKWALKRYPKSVIDLPDGSPAEGGLAMTSVSDGTVRLLVHPPMVKFSSADLSPDGRWFATADDKLIQETDNGPFKTIIEVYDTQTAKFSPQVRLAGNYVGIQWLSTEQFLATQTSSSRERYTDGDAEAEDIPDPVAVKIDAESGEVLQRLPERCYMTPLPDGGFLGAGIDSCWPGYGQDVGLQRYDPAAQQWLSFGDLKLEEYVFIERLALSPDGKYIAVSTGDEDGPVTHYILDAQTGRELRVKPAPGIDYIDEMSFDPDSSNLRISANRQIYTWNMVDGKWSELPFESQDTSVLASDGDILAIAGTFDDVIGLYDIKSGKTLPALDYGNISAGGFVPGKPLFWAFSQQGGIRIWDTRDWTELLTAYFFYNQGFMTVTPDGRYDSNIHPYKAQFRWLVSDAPFQSLNPDAFSRDYYSPGIGYRWLACSIEKNCRDAFEPVKSITDLNRTLPEVTIRSVEPGRDPTRATVTVAIKEGVNPDATNGKTHSGIYDPHILRNHQLVLRSGKHTQQQRLDITAWRKVKHIEADGTHVLKAEVTLPSGTGPRDRTPVITAYAFNEDRIKSETADYRYQRPDVPSRTPRAYVVTIGIDHYRQQRLNLSYAGADARLMGERLANIHGYDTRHLSIFSTGNRRTSGTAGQPEFVSKNIIRSLMALLAGENRDANLRALQKRGIDASMLEKATPDDLVILTYAGHGWADKSGDFFLIPSEAEWSSSEGTPERASLISSNELAGWLLPVDAGAMTFVIDACHSAASVENGSFIPGPLGDVGLGQLAFDKGVRILSATQADDVALEDARLRQGLLTYALAGEGLLPSGGKADQDRDGQIRMTEWLNYAVRRLPALSEEVSVGRFSGTSAPGTRAIVFHEAPANAPKRKVQKPSLFDFTIDSDNIVLRNRGG